MLDKISLRILNEITTENTTSEKKEVLLFGITRIVEDIPKTIGIVLIALLLGIIKEVAIVTVILILYKTFVGGVHAKTNLGCFIYSTVFYLAIIYSAKATNFSLEIQYYIYLLMYIFGMYCILVYAPADVEEIPKVNEKLRRTLKLKSIISITTVYLVAIFVIKDTNITRLIIYSLFYINLMTTRTIYKLFDAKYGFESYVPEELI